MFLQGGITPEYSCRPSSRVRLEPDSLTFQGGGSTRITQLETRFDDLASQVTQNIAMVTEVLDTQRDFKDMLLRLLNANSNSSPTPAIVNDAPPPDTETALNDPFPTPTARMNTPVAAAGGLVDPAPSWMSAETVLLTPNTRNNLGPRSRRIEDMQAVSTDISDQSVANGSMVESATASESIAQEPRSNSKGFLSPRAVVNMSTQRPPPPVLHDPHHVSVDIPTKTSRGRGLPTKLESVDDDTFDNPALKFPPRSSSEAIAVNKLCYLSHPDSGDRVVAEGKTGGSWKAKAQKFGHLCDPGEQMVQIHRVIVPNTRLLHVEVRQPFQTVDDAVVKPTGSNVFVKWDTRFLHKKTA